MLFEALLPCVMYPDAKSQKDRGKHAGFAKLLERICTRHREEHPGRLERARGFCTPEMTGDAQTNGRAQVQAPQCAQNHRFAGRRQVEKESRFSAAGRVRTLAASYWRYHDFPHHWPGAEHRNDRAVAKAPTFESGRSGSCRRRRERWHQSHVIA